MHVFVSFISFHCWRVEVDVCLRLIGEDLNFWMQTFGTIVEDVSLGCLCFVITLHQWKLRQLVMEMKNKTDFSCYFGFVFICSCNLCNWLSLSLCLSLAVITVQVWMQCTRPTVYIYHRFTCWSLLYSAVLHSWANSLRLHVILHEWTAFYTTSVLNIHRSGVHTVLVLLVPHETDTILARYVYTIQPCTMSLHTKPHAHLAVTCHLHF